VHQQRDAAGLSNSANQLRRGRPENLVLKKGASRYMQFLPIVGRTGQTCRSERVISPVNPQSFSGTCICLASAA
jgi:hypothetical protein